MCLTRKGIPWHFTDECHSAFSALKKAFTSAPVLTHWMPDVPITVETNTSDYALAAVLSITTPSSELHLVAFHSHTRIHSIPRNITTMFTTKSYLLSTKHSNNGNTISKVPATPLMWSPITGISNTSPQPKSSRIDKHVGLNTFLLSTSSSISIQENSEPSLTL